MDFARTPPFERHLRRIRREVTQRADDYTDVDVVAVEHLLFVFRFDDGSTVVDRFVSRPDVTEVEAAVATGFLDGVDSFFEVATDAEAAAPLLLVRCCLSELEHRVAPTLPAGMPALPAGTFLVGRLNPIAGTDLWTTSGVQRVYPASDRGAIAEAVSGLALRSPWLTHRNPEKLTLATERVAAIHAGFVARNGTDLLLVPGRELAEVYADMLAGPAGLDEVSAAANREKARAGIEGTPLADADQVLVHSHPVAGPGFYLDYPAVARALSAGTDADPGDLDLLRGYLDDPAVPAWLMRRVVEEHLPTADAALARATGRTGFSWERDGDQLLLDSEGDQVPRVPMAILPAMCVPSR